MLVSYTKGPILIFAPQRTGSSMLCEYLSKYYDVPNCSEMFYKQHPSSAKLAEIAKDNYSFVCKIYNLEDLESAIFNNKIQYKIRLTRRNLPAQLASYYISVMTNRWSFLVNDKDFEYVIEIDRKIFEQELENLIYTIKKYSSMDILFDQELCYEDITEKINQSQLITTRNSIKPINYREIVSYSSELLKGM